MAVEETSGSGPLKNDRVQVTLILSVGDCTISSTLDIVSVDWAVDSLLLSLALSTTDTTGVFRDDEYVVFSIVHNQNLPTLPPGNGPSLQANCTVAGTNSMWH